MQHDTFKKLTDVFSYPGNFLNKAKKHKKHLSVSQIHPDVKVSGGELAKSAPVTDEKGKYHHFLSVYTAGAVAAAAGRSPVASGLPSNTTTKSSLKSPSFFSSNNSNNDSSSALVSPIASKIVAEEEPPIVHYPLSVSSLNQFSPQRRIWLQHCLLPSGIAAEGGGAITAANMNVKVLKSGSAWDTAENHESNSASYNNPNEATGLLFVKRKCYKKRFSIVCVPVWVWVGV